MTVWWLNSNNNGGKYTEIVVNDNDCVPSSNININDEIDSNNNINRELVITRTRGSVAVFSVASIMMVVAFFVATTTTTTTTAPALAHYNSIREVGFVREAQQSVVVDVVGKKELTDDLCWGKTSFGEVCPTSKRTFGPLVTEGMGPRFYCYNPNNIRSLSYTPGMHFLNIHWNFVALNEQYTKPPTLLTNYVTKCIPYEPWPINNDDRMPDETPDPNPNPSW